LNNRYVFVVSEKIKGAARHTIRTKIEPKAGGQKQIQKALQYAKAQIDRWVGSKGLKPAGFIDSFKEFVATNPNTNENSKRQLEYAAEYYERFFKKKLVHEISHKDILDFINVIQAESLRNNEVRKDGSERGKQKKVKGCTPRTINRHLRTLKMFFGKYAVPNKLCQEDPTEHIEFLDVKAREG
jgi:hypothetical protein